MEFKNITQLFKYFPSFVNLDFFKINITGIFKMIFFCKFVKEAKLL